MANPSSATLIAMATMVATLGQNFENPSVYLSPIAQHTSNKPATTKIIQFIPTSFLF
jgi:hypothetical protein